MARVLMLVLALCTAGVGCARPPALPDAAREDARARDAGPLDTAVPDARTPDGGRDAAAGEMDAGDADRDASESMDAGDLDAGDGSLDVGGDVSLGGDAGPVDGGIVRRADPPTHPAAAPIAPFVECTVTTATDVVSGSEHRAPCDTIDYPVHPPTSGPHYSSWAAFQTYDAPVPWGFLVHAAEHGAVILAYHCETNADCDPVRAELAAIVADRGTDPVCRDELTPQRIIIVPDPTLTVPIAATAWDHVYTATCLDPPSLRAFIDAHYAMSPENFCFPGVDRSATGWCP